MNLQNRRGSLSFPFCFFFILSIFIFQTSHSTFFALREKYENLAAAGGNCNVVPLVNWSNFLLKIYLLFIYFADEKFCCSSSMCSYIFQKVDFFSVSLIFFCNLSVLSSFSDFFFLRRVLFFSWIKSYLTMLSIS